MKQEKTTFRIPVALLWLVVILTWVLTFYLLYYLFKHEAVLGLKYLWIGLVISLIVFIVDISISKIYNKAAWIIMLFITPQLTSTIYLIQKKRLLDLQRRKDKFTQK